MKSFYQVFLDLISNLLHTLPDCLTNWMKDFNKIFAFAFRGATTLGFLITGCIFYKNAIRN